MLRFVQSIADRILAIGIGRLLGLLLIFMFLILRAWDPVPVELLRLKTFDIYQIVKPRQITARPVVIIDIDEESLKEYGQFPWPRTRMADLVSKLHALGAAAIGFDVLFPEGDRMSPGSLAVTMKGIDDSMRSALSALPSNDFVFGDAIARARVVLGQSGHHTDIGSKTKWPNEATFAYIGG